MILPTSVNNKVTLPFCEGFMFTKLLLRNFAKIKPLQKVPNLQHSNLSWILIKVINEEKMKKKLVENYYCIFWSVSPVFILNCPKFIILQWFGSTLFFKMGIEFLKVICTDCLQGWIQLSFFTREWRKKRGDNKKPLPLQVCVPLSERNRNIKTNKILHR